ncbi:MAG: SDR family NAD(P)-dependent oxidoreductase, partial [Armatimonadetes bacterium]|nr:SDR family NAD(P)-dependent oxidoreductase [Armatimonadota bacterium]
TTLPDGVVLITPDPSGPSGVAPLLATALASRGARTHVLDAAALTCDERLTTAVADARRQHGRVGAVVHLSALEKSPMPTTLDAWKSLTQRDAKSLYRLVQLCLDDWAADTSPMVLAASLLDGTFGRRQGPSQGLPVGGGVQGFLKTVHLEHEHVRPRAVDFDGTLSPEAMAETLAAEILTPGPHFEIGYPQGRRVVFTASAETLATRPTPSVEPSPDWVMLVTGGASGITCETTRRMLRPGMKLLIVGRTPEPTAEPAELASLTTADQLRARLVDRARGTGRPPAQIEAELRSILHARVVRDNLASLRAAGAQVEYAALDVRNEQSFGTWLDDVYARHGRIDGVIHGAGVIEDRLVVDKTRDSLDRVFDTKVDSAFILYRHLRPESLRMLVFFASTAGRFGNRGQGDYAMANEVLNRLASRMATEWSSTRIIAVNWGPWATTGMASDAVNKAFVERGITPIPTDEGCALLLSELRNGASSTVEVVAGEGPWHKQIAEESVREPATR